MAWKEVFACVLGLACMYLKEDDYITYVAARKGNSLEE
jgi:hypothetical protein